MQTDMAEWQSISVVLWTCTHVLCSLRLTPISQNFGIWLYYSFKNTIQLILVDSPIWARNKQSDCSMSGCWGILCDIKLLKAGFWWFLGMNKSTTEHDTTKLITPFHSESTVHSIDINFSYYEKVSKIGKNPLDVEKSPWLDVWSKFCHFCNVLKTLNNSYQQTRHLELNRMVQTILSQHVWLLRYLCHFNPLKARFFGRFTKITDFLSIIDYLYQKSVNYQCLFLSMCLSVCLYVCLSVCPGSLGTR